MVSITRDTARALVGKFTAFAPFPQAQEGLTLTIDTLIASARSEAHARAIVEAIIEAPGDPMRWPSPDRIRSVAWALLAESEKVNPCEKCGGSGFVHVTRLVKGVPYEGSGPCSCRAPLPVVDNAAKKQSRDGRMASASDAMEGVSW